MRRGHSDREECLCASTVSQYYSRFRESLTKSIIGGEKDLLGNVVEMDEVFVACRSKGAKGRPVLSAGAWYLGLLQKAVNRAERPKLRLFPLINRSAGVIQKFVRENVAKGSTIHCDCFSSYRGLEADYTLKQVNHAHGEYAGQLGFGSQNIESVWRVLRRQLRMSNYRFSGDAAEKVFSASVFISLGINSKMTALQKMEVIAGRIGFPTGSLRSTTEIRFEAIEKTRKRALREINVTRKEIRKERRAAEEVEARTRGIFRDTDELLTRSA